MADMAGLRLSFAISTLRARDWFTGTVKAERRLAQERLNKETAMADPDDLPDDPALDTDEVETNRALEQGLGVGARELAAIGESGAAGTLERPLDEDGEPIEPEIEVDELGRSASVLDRKKPPQDDDKEQLDQESDA